MSANPISSQNPYANRGQPVPTERLVGRDGVIEDLVRRIRASVHCSIVGLPRIGKTSVALECIRSLESTNPTAKLVFLSVDTARDARDAWLKILNEVDPSANSVRSRSDYATETDALEALLDTLRKNAKKGTIVFMDEVDAVRRDAFGGAQPFMSMLREIGSNHSRYATTFVFISWRSLVWLHDVPVGLSDLSSICKIEYLKPLDKHHLQTLASQSPVTPDGLDALWDFTGGHPFLAEVLLCEAMEKRPNSVDRAAIEAAYEVQEHEFITQYRHIERLFAHDDLFRHLREWMAGRPKREPPPHVAPILRSYGLIKRAFPRGNDECMSADFRRYLEKLQRYHEANPAPIAITSTASNTSEAPSWHAFDDHPWVLANWPGSAIPVDTLRELLHEPKGHLPDEPPSVFLVKRIERGAWAHRSDKLHRLACEIPGDLVALPIPSLLASNAFTTHVDEALRRIDRPDEHPAGRLAMDVVFLRCAAVEKNLVDLPGGMVDLRQILPARFERLLVELRQPPRPNTLAEHERALLRVCQFVVQRWTAVERIPLAERLWLTWRLYQEVAERLEALDLDKRHDAIVRLALREPPDMGDPEDLLDPNGFGRVKFDHRLAAVLYALAFPDATPKSTQPRRVSSRGMEDLFRQWADQEPRGTEVRSVLDWHAPTNISDLALFALLRVRLSAFGELRPETRKRHFDALPLNPESAPSDMLELFDSIVHAASLSASKLSRDELERLHARLHDAVDSARTRKWRFMASTALFAAGEPSVESEARTLLVEHSRDPDAVYFAGMLLLRKATSSDASWTATVDELVQACVAQGADSFVIAAALGHVALHGPPNVNDAARQKLAEFEPMSHDRRLQDLKRFLGVRHGIQA